MLTCPWCSCSRVRISAERVKCQSCGSFWYRSMPSESALQSLYQDAPQGSSDEVCALGSTSEAIAKSLLRSVGWFDGAGKTLEIGAGFGAMTRILVQSGVPISVVEPFSSYDFQGLGVEFYRSLAEVPEGKKFKWIFLVEVIEHVADPVEFLKEVSRFIEPDGKVFVTTPNARGIAARVQAFGWRELANPTHLWLFSPDSLAEVFRRAGYSRFERQFSPIQYKSSFFKNILLSLTQRVGIDGGLRYVLSK